MSEVKRLCRGEGAMRRILYLDHSTRVDDLKGAAAAFGGRPVFSFEPA